MAQSNNGRMGRRLAMGTVAAAVVGGSAVLAGAGALSVPHPSIGLEIHWYGHNRAPVPNNSWRIVHNGRTVNSGRNASPAVFYTPVSPGTYDIVITAPGFRDYRETVRVTQGSARIYGAMFHR